MNKPANSKERNLIKGAIRRVFSRSELRRQALAPYRIQHQQEGKRTENWLWCPSCGVIYPAWQAEVDHIDPVIPIGHTLEDLTWDELIDRLWCELDNLQPLCSSCHKEKSKVERKLRSKKK